MLFKNEHKRKIQKMWVETRACTRKTLQKQRRLGRSCKGQRGRQRGRWKAPGQARAARRWQSVSSQSMTSRPPPHPTSSHSAGRGLAVSCLPCHYNKHTHTLLQLSTNITTCQRLHLIRFSNMTYLRNIDRSLRKFNTKNSIVGMKIMTITRLFYRP